MSEDKLLGMARALGLIDDPEKVEPWVTLHVALRAEVETLRDRIAELERRLDDADDYDRDQRDRGNR